MSFQSPLDRCSNLSASICMARISSLTLAPFTTAARSSWGPGPHPPDHGDRVRAGMRSPARPPPLRGRGALPSLPICARAQEFLTDVLCTAEYYLLSKIHGWPSSKVAAPALATRSSPNCHMFCPCATRFAPPHYHLRRHMIVAGVISGSSGSHHRDVSRLRARRLLRARRP